MPLCITMKETLLLKELVKEFYDPGPEILWCSEPYLQLQMECWGMIWKMLLLHLYKAHSKARDILINCWGYCSPIFCVLLEIIGQFGTGQFGTRQFGTMTILHQDNLATDNLAPGQFGTNIIKRTIWHQEKKWLSIIIHTCAQRAHNNTKTELLPKVLPKMFY